MDEELLIKFYQQTDEAATLHNNRNEKVEKMGGIGENKQLSCFNPEVCLPEVI